MSAIVQPVSSADGWRTGKYAGKHFGEMRYRHAFFVLHVWGELTGHRGAYGFRVSYVGLDRKLVPLPHERATGSGFKTRQEAQDACTAAVHAMHLAGVLELDPLLHEVRRI